MTTSTVLYERCFPTVEHFASRCANHGHRHFALLCFCDFNRDAEPKAWPPTGSCGSDLKQIRRLNFTLKVPGGKHKVLEISKSKTTIS